MKDRPDNSNLRFSNPIEAEVRLDAIMIREDFQIGPDKQCIHRKTKISTRL